MNLGLGCVSLGSGAGRQTRDDIRLVHEALDVGITVFDTADVYGGGASEHVLGRALRARRDEAVIATKGGYLFRDRTPVERWARRIAKGWKRAPRRPTSESWSSPSSSSSYALQSFSVGHLRQSVHGSLRRLGTDRIDVYQLHGPIEVLPRVFDELADLVAVGDVVRFGVGAASAESAESWIGVSGLRVLQVPLGLLDPDAAVTTVPRACAYDLEVWARGVLGGGMLALAERDPFAVATHPKREQIEAIRHIANGAGLDQYQLAFGYLRAVAPGVSTVLVGTTSADHLRRNVDAAAAPALPRDVLRALLAIPRVAPKGP